MLDVRAWAYVSSCASMVWVGCAAKPLSTLDVCAGVGTGDLVVTEIHANPEGADGAGEYLELFNASGAPVSLEGLTVAASRADGGGSKSHRLTEGSVGAGEYVVLGNAVASGDAALPAHLDYGYGDALGRMRNSEGTLAVHCGDVLVDQVTYGRAEEGRALELDGRFAPDHRVNDDGAHWCSSPDGVSAFDNGNFGSPGAPNHPCELESLGEGLCLEGESARGALSPRPGELRITEWMPNPKGVDADLEWVEVKLESDMDLNGLMLGPSEEELSGVVDRDACFSLDAGSRVVFGASPGAAPRVDASLSFSLGNSGTRSIVAAADGVVLDRIDYDDSVEGRAWQRDEDGAVCLASADEYSADNFGTPGEPNPPCPPLLGPDECLDGDEPRAIDRPTPGEVSISEWMANPEAADPLLGEWVEIRFLAEADLNGLVLSDLTGESAPIESESCLKVEPGDHVVLSRSLDSLENGGLDEATALLGVSLNNRDETLTLSVAGEILDTVSYARSEPGVAQQVDALGNRCAAEHAYGDGDLGTPGFENPSCP